jgi:hypothetical protein
MNSVYSTDDIPGLRLSVKAAFALGRATNDEAVFNLKRDLAERLACDILKQENFFESKATEVHGTVFIGYRADCIILTEEEYFSLKRTAFQDGIQHAVGAMSPSQRMGTWAQP